MIQTLILMVLALIIAAGYLELRDMPRSTARRQPVMHRTYYSDTRDTGFGG